MSDASVLLRHPTVPDGRVIRNEPRLGENRERQPVPGRTCGTCTMCCKLYAVPPMQKAADVWCRECAPGRGCKIWENRPKFCADFHCHYILDPNIGPDWRPDVCKFIMNFQTATTLWVKVDPAHKLAWRREPYYSVIKRWSTDFIAAGGYILVGDSINLYCVTPNDDEIVGRYGQPVNFRVETTQVGAVKAYRVINKMAQPA